MRSDVVRPKASDYNRSMTPDNFQRVLRRFLRRSPFRPFTLELLSGGRVEVNHPEAITLSANGVVTVWSTSRLRSIFEVTEVVRFITETGTT
jgi:20S proteasome alpha/beta subunit